MIVPALPLHELTHAIVAQPWADQVDIDWHDPVTTMRWVDAPPQAVILAHIAPLMIGCLIGATGLLLLAQGFVPDLSLITWAWIAGNWINYTALSARDLSIFRTQRGLQQ